jgi:hypothetical protein
MPRKQRQQESKVAFGGADAADYAAALEAARPKAELLLEQYREDPTGPAAELVSLVIVNHLAQEDLRPEEGEIRVLQEERQRRQTAEQQAETLAAERRRLRRQNRKLAAARVEESLRLQSAGQQLEEARKAAAAGKMPDTMEIIERISAAIGIRGPLIPRVEKTADGRPLALPGALPGPGRPSEGV